MRSARCVPPFAPAGALGGHRRVLRAARAARPGVGRAGTEIATSARRGESMDVVLAVLPLVMSYLWATGHLVMH